MSKPLVRLYRGIPGSGKSTLIKQWTESLPKEICEEQIKLFSADLFWGEAYAFDPKRIGEAHAWCFREYLKCLNYRYYHGSDDDGINHMIVDNTNIRAWELAPYIQAANAYRFDHEIITVLCDPAVAAIRNVHGVPPQVVWDMHRHLIVEELPPFWKQTTVFNTLNQPAVPAGVAILEDKP